MASQPDIAMKDEKRDEQPGQPLDNETLTEHNNTEISVTLDSMDTSTTDANIGMNNETSKTPEHLREGTAVQSQGPMSKSQLKKIARKKRLEETRAEWKAGKRAKDKARKMRRKEEKRVAREHTAEEPSVEGNETGQKRKADEESLGEEDSATKKSKVDPPLHNKRVLEPITLILDCGFDELMTEKEIVSLSQQITRCYSSNRKSKHQVSLHVSSFNGRLRERAENTLKGQHLLWKGITFAEEPYTVTEKDKTGDGDLVYLTADSDHTIETLEPGKKYIIGGIVDRNRHKNICYKKATEQGIKTARLPIGDYIKMASRHVLTTNQVIEIMLKYLETRDWEKAFMSEIPQRKMPLLASSTEGSQDGEKPTGTGNDVKDTSTEDNSTSYLELVEENKDQTD